MATASVTYTFSAGGNAVGSEVNTNFSDLVSFLNTNCIQKDGSVAFTGAVTLAGAPTNSLHAATKAYVDASGGGSLANTQTMSSKLLSSSTQSDWGSILTAANPAVAVATFAWVSGYFEGSGMADDAAVRIGISLDGGATYTYQTVNLEDQDGSDPQAVALHHCVLGTPTGDVKVKAQAAYISGGGGTLYNGRLSYLVVVT